MKKITLITVTALILLSCRKEVSISENVDKVPDEILILDDRIVFPDESSFDKYFRSEDQQKSVDLKVSENNFLSFAAHRQSNTLNPDQRNGKHCDVPSELVEDNQRFFKLLNKDGILQVGEYIIRYSYCDGGAWVIKSDNYKREQYRSDFMQGKLVDNIVGFFPDDVDGFEALEMGYISMPEKGTEAYNKLKGTVDDPIKKITALYLFAHTGYEHFYIDNISDNTARLRGKLSYDKFVFYFNFYGKEKYQLNKAQGWTTQPLLPGDRSEWILDYEYRCRRKGISYDYTGSGTAYPGHKGVTENKAEIIFYDGSRGLRYGTASFKVYNVHSNKRQIYRGSGEGAGMILIANQHFGTYLYTNNYKDIPGIAGDGEMGISF